MNLHAPVRLTELAQGAGCAAKMGPGDLSAMLKPLQAIFSQANYPDLLRGLERPDDAAVYRLDDQRSLVFTTDFFPPMVDDPYSFGQIAAANALSDIFAMGAEPLVALNIAAFPANIDPAVAAEIIRGGAEKVREAGAVIAGGHTISDVEPKYGLAVVGIAPTNSFFTKQGARPGDRLYLTKKLGTGILTTAHKRDLISPDHLDEAVRSMTRLNRKAGQLLQQQAMAIQAATDITGFSLIGHGHEIAKSSGCALRFEFDLLPWLPGAQTHAANGISTGGGARNAAYYSTYLSEETGLDAAKRSLIFDPQTSGGLLLAVDPCHAAMVEQAFVSQDEPLHLVGAAVDGPSGQVIIA